MIYIHTSMSSRVRKDFLIKLATNAPIGNKYFFTKYCHRQTYQNYEQSQQNLGTFLVNEVR